MVWPRSRRSDWSRRPQPTTTAASTACSESGSTGSHALLLVAITGTGAVVAGFSRRSVDDEARTSRYFALVTLVVGASTLVVLPGPALALALGWLASGWALTLLIGWQPGWETARRAQRRILSTLAVGDVALITTLIALVSVDAGGATRGDAAATAALASSSILSLRSDPRRCTVARDREARHVLHCSRSTGG